MRARLPQIEYFIMQCYNIGTRTSTAGEAIAGSFFFSLVLFMLILCVLLFTN